MSYILLIEDNQANADMILHILRTAGFEVRHYLRGLEGAKVARREPPDLILMDFNLPDIDGRTLSLLLSRQLVNVPIVACTSHTGEYESRMAANFGCTAFLSKPFRPDDLLGLVKRMFQDKPLPQDTEMKSKPEPS